MNDNSHGVLRTDGVLPSDNDVYISGSQIKKFSLRNGDEVSGPARLPRDKEKYLSLLRVDTVYGKPAVKAASRPFFHKLTPIFPNKQIKLETKSDVVSTRMIDLLAPIGFGQRAMVVAQPKTGKTWLMKEIADGIAQNHPEAKLMVVLVGERPEEVTDMQRSVKGEVFASNFDEMPEHNCRVAEMALEKAKRMVEWGEDVIILMDSITRLARAYNITMPTSGKTLSGGFDPVAGLCILSAASLAVGIYNTNEISRMKSIMRFDENMLDFVYSWTFYHDAQLSMLPHYSEVSAMNFDQVAALAY